MNKLAAKAKAPATVQVQVRSSTASVKTVLAVSEALAPATSETALMMLPRTPEEEERASRAAMASSYASVAAEQVIASAEVVWLRDEHATMAPMTDGFEFAGFSVKL